MENDPDTGNIHGQLDDIERLLKKINSAIISNSRSLKPKSLINTGYWQWDADKGKILLDNDCVKIFDLPQKKKKSFYKNWPEILPAAAAGHLESTLHQSTKNKTHQSQFVISLPGTDRNFFIHAQWIAEKKQWQGILIELDINILQPEDSQLSTTINNLPIGVITLNKTAEILSANTAFLKMFGIKSDKIWQNEAVTSLPPIRSAGLEHYFTELCTKNIEFEFESPELQNYSDEQVFLYCRGFVLSDRNSQYMILFSDITRRKQLEEQFTQYQRLESIGNLAGGIAHDFNNILTVIKGASAFVMRDLDRENEHYQNLDQIHRAAERAESLTQQLLAFSRRQLLQPKIINLNALITGLHDQIRSQLNKNIEIKSILAKDTGRIKADPHQIEQVLKNLVLNANDAMPRGGLLTVETANQNLDEDYLQRRPLVKPGRYVVLSISDNGRGMDKNTQAHIFEPFFTTKEKGRGTGLGLSTVYGIVKQSNGYIWVYSEPNRGTVVKLYFPYYDEVVEGEIKTGVSDRNLRGTETVLVVDDEEEVRNLVSEMLRFYGYNVLEAPNAANALLIFEKYNQSVDLVLTDIVMPQMNGVEMMEKIIPRFPDTRVIFMSGYTDNTLDEYELIDKSTNYLQKPFNAQSLVAKIREIIDA